MANTLHGPFVKGASTATGSYGTGVGQSNTFTSGNANNDETQSAVALHSFNPHMIGAGFVLSGVACTKDGTTASQLDVASGEAYLIQSDGTPTLCDVASTNFSTTGNPSTTLYLFLNADGSWAWQLSSTGLTNSLAICHVTTDGSANIATVVDTRPTAVSLLSTMAGLLTLPGLSKLTSDGGLITTDGHGQMAIKGATGDYNALTMTSPNASTQAIMGSGDASYLNGSGFFIFTGGGPDGYVMRNWDGTGGTISGAIKSLGQQATVGSFGVPVIVAQAINTHVTVTTQQTILTYTPSSNQVLRINAEFYVSATTTPLVGYGYTPVNRNTLMSPIAMCNANGSTYLGAGGASVAGGFDVATTPQVIYAKSGAAVTCVFQDTTGTPSDFVTFMIERLA